MTISGREKNQKAQEYDKINYCCPRKTQTEDRKD